MSEMESYRLLFVAESRENHESIVQNLLILEQGSDETAIDNIFRSAHSLKGMSASMGYSTMEEVCHALEDVFSRIRNDTLQVSQQLIDDLLAGVDDIEMMIDDIETGGDGNVIDLEARVASLKKWLSADTGHPLPADSGTPEVLPARTQPGQTPSSPSVTQTEPSGSRSYHVHLTLSDTCDSKNLRAMIVLQNLESIGTISSLTPPRETIEDDESFDGTIDIVMTSDSGDEAIAIITGTSDIASVSIEKKDVTMITGAASPKTPAPPSSSSVGLVTYNIRLGMSDTCDSKNLRAMLFLGNLEGIGTISSLTPSRETIEDDTSFSGSMEITVQTDAEKDILQKMISSSDFAHGSVEQSGIQTPSAAPEETAHPKKEGMAPVSPPPSSPAEKPEYSIHVVISDICDSKNLRAMLIVSNLTTIGEIVAITPPVNTIEDDQNFTGVLDIRLASESDRARIESFLKGSDVASYTVIPPGGKEEPVRATPVMKRSEERPAEQRPSVAAARDDAAPKKVREVKNIRVDIERLDHMMNLVEDLVINRGRLELIAEKYRIKELDETLNMVNRSVADLQVLMMDIRMIPLNQIFNRFPRTVRDIAAKEGKEVDFIIEGGDTELDRSVMDGLNDPLLHLIRNAIDHGIESPKERREAGKNPKGILRLSASRDKDNVVLVIEDDGKGLNAEVIKKKALQKGLSTKEALDDLSDEEAYELLFLPGFSTAEKITDISGRGVGLDVVRTSINALQGTIKLDSESGIGTRFELVLPPTMAIVMVMMVRMNNRRCAIPINNVAEVASLAAFPIRRIGKGEAILMREEIITLYPLDDMFGKSENGEILIILQYQNQKGAIIADLIEGQQEVVIKPLSKFVGSCEGISGVTIPGDGEVVPVLDVNSIIKEPTTQRSTKKKSKTVVTSAVTTQEKDSGIIFSEKNCDTLKELGNIGAAHAATTLSTMLNTTIAIEVPEITIVDLAEVSRYVSDDRAALVAFQIQGEVGGDGFIILYVENDSIIPLTNIMIGTSGTDRLIGEMDESALKEVGNIMISSFLDAIAALLGIILLPSPPYLTIDMALAGIQSILAIQNQSLDINEVMLFKTELLCDEYHINSNLFLLPDQKMLAELLARMEKLLAV